MQTLVVLLALIACACAQHGPPHRLPKDLPPGFADILPPDVVAKMRAVHRDESLTGEQQMEKIHEIMNTVPDSIREKLPKPPGFDRLPAATRAELDKIHRDKTLTFHQRHEKIKKIFDALPPHLRPPPPPPPPPTL
ncbi:hypothetical protein RB195_003581 [Necator americanus]|uniref:SXP/RAL-2 family protein Ani s 5-like cation-binding domain-containing protein n=1 Tax=Necator americanus TaxID=51031 RepID=A0ABR1DP88_NECAM